MRVQGTGTNAGKIQGAGIYASHISVVGALGLEPRASWSQTRRASQLRHAPKSGGTIALVRVVVNTVVSVSLLARFSQKCLS